MTTGEVVEDLGAEVVTDEIAVTDTLTEFDIEVVEESGDGVAEVVEETTETIIEESGAVTEVIEDKGEQGPPGAPGAAMAEESVRVIATDEVEELRIDMDALVAATLFKE